MARKWLQSVDVETDEAGKPSFETALEALAALIESGRLKVDAAGVTLTCDLIDLDVAAITGTAPSAATLYDLLIALGAPAQAGEIAAALPDPATETTLRIPRMPAASISGTCCGLGQAPTAK